MFGFLRKSSRYSWKAAKYQLFADDIFRAKYGIRVNDAGDFKMAQITYDIFQQMENEGDVSPERYTKLLELKFLELGLIRNT